ncbi:unnamed protein product [Paramecium sonneborni]|uniref:EGF-like domain-containing protein n=1 Tax=Paramecium sonneborni TaxID=65129 RepID=A0A8S1R2X2_9CILI|nr:unnamed protein product [Paramecium sonneborni]
MNLLLSYIIIFNLLFFETITHLLSVTQSTPMIKLINQTISQFNPTSNFNTTLQIEGDGFIFLIVEFQQTSSDKSSIALLYNEHFPTSQINQTIQFRDMDYNSYVLKRQNHNLIIQNFPHLKFITILSNISITFNLILTGTNEQKCFNDCNNNGKCFQGKCLCSSNYIGIDCQFKAIELEIQTQQNLSLSNYVTFLYYKQQEKSKELNLIFYTNSQQNLTILEIISSFIHIPTLQYYDYYEKFNTSYPLKQIISSKGLKDLDDDDDHLNEDTDDDNSDLLQQNNFLLNKQIPAKLVIAVLCSIPNTQISILLQKRQDQIDKQEYLKWIIPLSIFGFIIIFIFGIICLKKHLTKKKFENKYTKVQSFSDDEICTLCQKRLIIRNAIYKSIVCQNNHLLHKKCLIKFFDKNQNFGLCPTCPQIIID